MPSSKTVKDQKKVLLIDDEVNLTQVLSMLLETRGYRVTVAHSAKEAMDLLSSHFDLVILDIILPDSNGFEICRRIKQSEKTRHIPVIILSAQSLYQDRVEGLYLGADDFLAKPCEHEELFARMEAVLRRGRNAALHENNDKVVILELRRILDEALIVPFFQPIFLLEPFSLFGLEMLARPTVDGLLASPEFFFSTALQYGFYTELEILSWSIALENITPHLKGEKIFLNCSPYFIESSHFLDVKMLFEKHTIAPSDVVLEITERSAIADYQLFYERLSRYRDHGFRFAVDDVGGGYASLESIVETKPEIVKIDKRITHGLCDDRFKQSVVKFMVAFCRENGITSIAEGIETKEELDLIRKLGVNAGQGYYLARPTADLDLAYLRSVLL